ncbi:MAG: DUF4988 domain-containing protein, partial [Clostridia bacterium]|nr:DUF4988 domain-containing protein [Clostridia bacterium]
MKGILKKLAAVSTATVMCVGVGMLAACSKSGEAGPQGPKGENGVTPHIGTDGYWYIGNVKTEYKAQGEAGATPVIEIKNGYWYINGENTNVKAEGSSSSGGSTVEIKDGYWYVDGENTGVKAEGTDGTDGDDGVTPTITISTDGYWVINGEKTDTKAQGADGKNPTVTISGDGYWVIDGEKTDTLAQGVMGTVWFTGRGLPTEAVNAANLTEAKAGDFYVNTNTNTIYILGSDGETWSVLVNVNEQHNVSVWDGTIPGWQAPNLSDEEIVNNRPVSYVVDEDAKSVDIYNAEAFAWFAYRSVIGKEGYKGWTVTLHCDIDLNNHMWIPIGLGARSNAEGEPFQGTFDGNGHTIYNLSSNGFMEALRYGEFETKGETRTGIYLPYVNHAGEDNEVEFNIPVHINEDNEMPYGLFATTRNATIKNLNVENISIDLTARRFGEVGAIHNANFNFDVLADSVATFVGYAYGSLSLENLRAGSQNGTDYITNACAAAGIVARVYCGEGTNADGVIDGKTPDENGNYGTLSIKNCVSHVNINGLEANGDTIYYRGQSDVTSGYNPWGNDKSGGILADARYYSKIEVVDCENYGDIVGHSVGGIIGARQGTGKMVSPSRIEGCKNYGTLSADYYGGGIIGYRNVSGNGSNSSYVISNCVNYGTVRARVRIEGVNEDGSFITTVTASGLGGIVGLFDLKTANAAIVSCANYGDIEVPGANSVGGIVGFVQLTKLEQGTGKLAILNCINGGTLKSNGTT